MSSRFLLTSALMLLPGLALASTPAPSTANPHTTAAAAQTGPANAVVGVWTTPNDKSRVRIYRNADGTFAGKIIWLKKPTYPANYKNKALAGKPKVDNHNPDKSLRSRPVMGMDVLQHFKYFAKENNWRHGKCYDPEDGKTYTCKMWLTKKGHGNVLKVRGYVWIFFKTQTWHRYTPPAYPASTPARAIQSGQSGQ